MNLNKPLNRCLNLNQTSVSSGIVRLVSALYRRRCLRPTRKTQIYFLHSHSNCPDQILPPVLKYVHREKSHCWFVKSQLIHLSDVFEVKFQVRGENPGFMLKRRCDIITSCHLATSRPVMLASRRFFLNVAFILRGCVK